MPIVSLSEFSLRRAATAILAIATITGGVACYPKAGAAPTSVSPGSVAWAANKWPGTSEQALQEGRRTFLAKCNACHDYPDLSAISDEEWPDIVARMGDKADLDEARTKGVLQFILASKHP